MALTYQEILGGISFVLALVGTVVYIVSVVLGKTKPHLYTWLVFSILTAIAFFAQLVGKAGPGAWMMGGTAAGCAVIALLSLQYGEKSRTKADRISLVAALLAIVLWLATDDPLLSVILISLIDGVAMVPTIRKSLADPYGENLTSYVIANVKGVLSLAALTSFTLITSLYIISIFVVNSSLIAVCLYGRQRDARSKA